MKKPGAALVGGWLSIALIFFLLGWGTAKNSAAEPKRANGSEASVVQSSLGADLKIPNIDEVFHILRTAYYDSTKLELSKLTAGAVRGFVAGIGDAYTVYMTPEETKDFENGLEGQLEGIGAELEVKLGKLVVVTPLKNSPAEKSGVRSGDIIFKIDGKLAEEMSLYEAIRKIRGPKGTQVTLMLVREKLAEPLELKITRQEIVLDSVEEVALKGGIMHVTVNQFNEHTTAEFNNAVQKILLDHPRGLILDVRGNGGGYLDISVAMLSEIIGPNKIAVITKQRDATKNEEIKTHAGGRLTDIPLVVLVNKGSASASEIVAGAIQDYKRGIIVGEKTFGKGSVQEIDKLRDGSSLRFTVAKWFTPLSRGVDEVGITPDREVPLTEEDIKAKRDPQLEEAVKILGS